MTPPKENECHQKRTGYGIYTYLPMIEWWGWLYHEYNIPITPCFTFPSIITTTIKIRIFIYMLNLETFLTDI